MNILSLCDGMSCGRVALERAGIKVDKYYASEIKEIAKRVSKDNYPDIVQIGNVRKVKYEDGVLHTENGSFKEHFDLVMFGSPCQTFSIACKKDRRIGLSDEEKSGIFLECYRVLKEVNPKCFFVENVASMKKEDRDYLSNCLGVEPIRINSEVVAPAIRNRLYWTNIPITRELGAKDIKLQDILEDGYTDREKARCLMSSDSRPHITPVKMVHRYFSTGFTTLIFKSKEHYDACVDEYKKMLGGRRKIKADMLKDSEVFEGVRYMTRHELEKCQTLPHDYTKCLSRKVAANVIGDGWTIDVIAYILKNLKEV